MPPLWFTDSVAGLVRLFEGWGVKLYGATSGSIQVLPPVSPTNQAYTLPSALPVSNGQVLSSTTAGLLSWATSAAGQAWTELTTTSATLVVGHGYICNNVSRVVTTLPTTMALGDTISLVGKGAGGWSVRPAAGQTIHFGTQSSDVSVLSQAALDCITLTCITANSDWTVTSSIGNLTVT